MQRYKIEDVARTPPTRIQISSALDPQDEQNYIQKKKQCNQSIIINISSELNLDNIISIRKPSPEYQDIPPVSEIENVATHLPQNDAAKNEFDFGIELVPALQSTSDADPPNTPINSFDEPVQAGAENISRVIQRQMLPIERPSMQYKRRPKDLIITQRSTPGPDDKFSHFSATKLRTNQTATNVPTSPVITAVLGSIKAPPNKISYKQSIQLTPEVRHPDASYCPHRERFSGTLMHSRNGSLISIRSSQRIIPIRTVTSSLISPSCGKYISNGLTSKNHDLKQSMSSIPLPPSANSGLEKLCSRWSAETMSLASATAPVPGYNHAITSLGSPCEITLRRDLEKLGEKYPDCFFEDDEDDDVLSRRGLGKKDTDIGTRIVRIMLCGGCV